MKSMVYVFLWLQQYVNNSYYTRFNVYLSTQNFYFADKNIIVNENFITSLLHGITVFEIFETGLIKSLTISFGF